MTRIEIVAAVKATGFSFFTDADVNTLVDQACAEFQTAELWPWRLTTTETAAPAIVVDLGEIDSVTLAGTALDPARLSDLEDQFDDLTASGTPTDYYLSDRDEDGGTVNVFPVSTDDIAIRHYRRRFWITGGRTAASDTDTPMGPYEGHELVQMLATARAHRLNNAPELAAAWRQEYELLLNIMRDRELAILGGVDEPDRVGFSDLW